jgi:hypothetical protein
MVRKITSLFLFLSLPVLASQITLREGERVASLKKVKNYWISANCHKCEAEKVMESLTAVKAKAAAEKMSDARIAPSTRLCNGLEGMVWALRDEDGATHTICEFKDKSYVLTNDLAALLP